ncbi:MAG TPA: hypothetical protein VLE73_04635 [Candidatus Saccharimonadales bacterium]|nr:hypothetical protein [Candidatus Saccharimonadales bacterium]
MSNLQERITETREHVLRLLDGTLGVEPACFAVEDLNLRLDANAITAVGEETGTWDDGEFGDEVRSCVDHWTETNGSVTEVRAARPREGSVLAAYFIAAPPMVGGRSAALRIKVPEHPVDNVLTHTSVGFGRMELPTYEGVDRPTLFVAFGKQRYLHEAHRLRAFSALIDCANLALRAVVV